MEVKPDGFNKYSITFTENEFKIMYDKACELDTTVCDLISDTVGSVLIDAIEAEYRDE